MFPTMFDNGLVPYGLRRCNQDRDHLIDESSYQSILREFLHQQSLQHKFFHRR